MGTGDNKALFVQLVKTWFLVGGGVWDCGGTPPDRGCTSTRGKAPHPPIHRREDALVNGPQPSPLRGEGINKYGDTPLNLDMSTWLGTSSPALPDLLQRRRVKFGIEFHFALLLWRSCHEVTDEVPNRTL